MGEKSSLCLKGFTQVAQNMKHMIYSEIMEFKSKPHHQSNLTCKMLYFLAQQTA